MSRYESALSVCTIRLLFPGIESMREFNDSRDFIPHHLCVCILTCLDGRLPADVRLDEVDDYAWSSVFSLEEMLVIMTEAESLKTERSGTANVDHVSCSRQTHEVGCVSAEDDCVH